MIKYRILIGLCCTFLSSSLELGGGSELMQQEGPPNLCKGTSVSLPAPWGCRPTARTRAYPGASMLLPRSRRALASVCWTPDSKGFAVMMTLERLEPGMGSRAGKVTERPRVSLATLTVSNTRFCWALPRREAFVSVAVIH